jgi:hypothetical protein
VSGCSAMQVVILDVGAHVLQRTDLTTRPIRTYVRTVGTNRRYGSDLTDDGSPSTILVATASKL